MRSVARAIERLGLAVVSVSWPPPDIPSALRRIGLTAPAFLHWSRKRVFETVAASMPDAVLVVKGQYLSASYVKRLRDVSRGPIVCWNPDSPFDSAISNRGGGVRSAVGAYDWYVTWSELLVEQLERRGQRAIRIPFGWDDELHFPGEACDPTVAGRPVFVGTWTPSRDRELSQLGRLGLVVFGNGWSQSGNSYEVRPPVYGSDFARVVRSAGCAINLLREQNRDSHNMRTFEIPGCGGLQVAPWTPDHARWLETNTELYRPTDESLESVVERTLMRRVVNAGTVPSWLTNHRYVDRAKKLLEFLGIAAQ